ncbi:MAG TPA: Dabb family protein [Methylomirabilota bacterium]|nr:Dabb family protein [Methylomirabilota bacterium]
MPKVKHVGLIKFKEGTTEEQIDQLFDEVLDLTEAVDGIEDYVAGANNSPESMNNGFTHGYVMTFTEPANRDAFVQHAEHSRVKGRLLDHADAYVVLDFEVS